MLSIYFVFMRLSDRVNQRVLFGASARILAANLSGSAWRVELDIPQQIVTPGLVPGIHVFLAAS